jgi:hypothetical protein
MRWKSGVCSWLIAAAAVAYRPPIDTTGPLTARIEGPSEIQATGQKQAVTVVLENSGETTLRGIVRVGVIDHWRVAPAGPVPFSVPAKGQLRVPFTVTAGDPSYSAFYPVHAFAEFESAGKREQVHPILIVPLRLAEAPPREASGAATTSGTAVRPVPPPCPATGGSQMLGTAGGYEVRVWPARRGLLDAVIGFGRGSQWLCFQGFQVRVLGAALEDPGSAHHLAGVRTETGGGRYRVRHRFRGEAGAFDLITECWIERGALRIRLAIANAVHRPWRHMHLEDVAAGPWSVRPARIYAGPGNVMQDPAAFRLKANGHYMATSYVGMDFAGGISMLQGVDVPPDHLAADPASGLCSLHTPHNQTLTFIPTGNVWEAVKAFRALNNPRAAGGVARLAGRFVFDLWSGRYGESADALRRSFRYGLTDAVVIWHRWQRWGYDYRLPDIYPPNTEWGTREEFLDLAGTCKRNGALFAPHDNYMDFYPDSDGFSYENIAFNANRTPQTAWFNQGAGAQSYHPRSDRVLSFVQRNIRLIKDGFAPGAYFIDVWSSEPPYDYYTSTGEFFDRVYTRDIWREGFAWIRSHLDGAPQLSEAGADQYIGWLDGGSAAQMRAEAGPERSNVWRIQTSDTERVPWFDMAYHDVFALHGAGYTARYASGQDPRAHGIYSDDYIVTEVMTGHPGMVSEAFGRDPVRKYWLLHDLMRGLAMARMESFVFEGGNLHRHTIGWDGGGLVHVNRGGNRWTAAGHDLPQYGFWARVPSREGHLEAAIEYRDGLIVEWSRSPAMMYVNARPVVLDKLLPLRTAKSRNRPPQPEPDPRPARMNPENKIAGFGAVSTNGGLRLRPVGTTLELTPLPFSPPFTVRIRWQELPWKLALPREVEAVNEGGRVIRRMPLHEQRGEIRLTCEPDVFAYRFR